MLSETLWVVIYDKFDFMTGLYLKEPYFDKIFVDAEEAQDYADSKYSDDPDIYYFLAAAIFKNNTL